MDLTMWLFYTIEAAYSWKEEVQLHLTEVREDHDLLILSMY